MTYLNTVSASDKLLSSLHAGMLEVILIDMPINTAKALIQWSSGLSNRLGGYKDYTFITPPPLA